MQQAWVSWSRFNLSDVFASTFNFLHVLGRKDGTRRCFFLGLTCYYRKGKAVKSIRTVPPNQEVVLVRFLNYFIYLPTFKPCAESGVCVEFYRHPHAPDAAPSLLEVHPTDP